jgi:GNAT superfamily N-acetyltransferase
MDAGGPVNGEASPGFVRRGTPADAAALAEFAARTFAETFGPDNTAEDLAAYLAAAYGPETQARELADPDCITLIIDTSDTADTPVGAPDVIGAFAQVRRHQPPSCVTGADPVELRRFYVDRSWHGHGLAQRLMAGVHDAAHELGGRTIWLGVWERNARAIAFYEKEGFTDTGATRFCVGSDRQTDRVMVREVRLADPRR